MLTIFAKSSILDVWQGSVYNCVYSDWEFFLTFNCDQQLVTVAILTVIYNFFYKPYEKKLELDHLKSRTPKETQVKPCEMLPRVSLLHI